MKQGKCLAQQLPNKKNYSVLRQPSHKKHSPKFIKVNISGTLLKGFQELKRGFKKHEKLFPAKNISLKLLTKK
jgi:hypothetical protein